MQTQRYRADAPEPGRMYCVVMRHIARPAVHQVALCGPGAV